MAATLIPFHPTAASIAAAKAAQQRERARAEQAAGVEIDADGRFVLHAVAGCCPKCFEIVVGRTQGLADRAMAAHLVKYHRPVPQGAA